VEAGDSGLLGFDEVMSAVFYATQRPRQSAAKPSGLAALLCVFYNFFGRRKALLDTSSQGSRKERSFYQSKRKRFIPIPWK
jgi:hypothetical protein